MMGLLSVKNNGIIASKYRGYESHPCEFVWLNTEAFTVQLSPAANADQLRDLANLTRLSVLGKGDALAPRYHKPLYKQIKTGQVAITWLRIGVQISPPLRVMSVGYKSGQGSEKALGADASLVCSGRCASLNGMCTSQARSARCNID
jgi:hypothetical protein